MWMLLKNWVLGLGGIVALLATLKLYVFKRERKAVQDFKNDQLIKSNEVEQNAQKAVEREKASVDGIPTSDLVDRLRGRTNDWKRL